jgi:hypothetical protein
MCLNQSVKLGVPAKWAVAGSAADFLIVVSPSYVSPSHNQVRNPVSPLRATCVQVREIEYSKMVEQSS